MIVYEPEVFYKTTFQDPERITERSTSGPHLIDGWAMSTGGAIRLFSQDRKKMWFKSVYAAACYEGFDYVGHRIG